MATYEVKGPQGEIYHIDGPDDADPSAVIAQVTGHRFGSGAAGMKDAVGGQLVPSLSPEAKAAQSPTSDMNAGQRYLAGIGEAQTNLARGVGQMIPTYSAPTLSGQITGDKGGWGTLVSRQDVADARTRDAALNQTTAGKLGNITGNVVTTLPALAIPGANTVAGAGLTGAGLGLLQPSTSTKETLLNTGIGGATGAAGQWLGNKITNWTSGRLAARQVAADTEESLNSARDAILKQSRAEGYVIPPTAANDSAVATAAESISGKAATRQAAEAINARVSNRLVAQDLNLPTDQPITKSVLEGVRQKAGQVYGQVKQAGTIVKDAAFQNDVQGLTQIGADLEAAAPGIGAQASEKVTQLAQSLLANPDVDAKDAVGLYRLLNERAKDNFKAAFGGGGDSQALELAKAQRGAADALGDLIQRHLQGQGQGNLATAWQDARRTIAKSYTAEAALKGNNIDALRLTSQLRKGAPLTDGFRKVAEFGDQFGEAARVPKSGTGVSKLAATVGGGGALTALLTGQPHLAAGLAAGSAAPYALRRAMLSAPGQAMLASPSYGPGLLGNVGLQATGLLGRYGTLPAYTAGNALVQPLQK